MPVDTLGEDLVLLAIRPGNGKIAARERLGYGLRGSELVRLAASGRVGITGDRIVVLDGGPTGDERLDAALASLARPRRRPLRPKAWVGQPPSGICDAYLARLAAAGAVREERGKLLGFIPVSRWRIADPARAADARARLDAIVHAPGQVGIAQAAYAGLASASGLGPVLYPGPAGRPLRRRLEQIAKGELTRPAARQAGQAAQAATRITADAAQPDVAGNVMDAADNALDRSHAGRGHRRGHARRHAGRHARGRVGRRPRGAPCGPRRRGTRRARRRRRAITRTVAADGRGVGSLSWAPGVPTAAPTWAGGSASSGKRPA